MGALLKADFLGNGCSQLLQPQSLKDQGSIPLTRFLSAAQIPGSLHARHRKTASSSLKNGLDGSKTSSSCSFSDCGSASVQKPASLVRAYQTKPFFRPQTHGFLSSQKKWALSAGLEDPSEVVEAAQQAGGEMSEAIEGGAEGLVKSSEALFGAAAAAGVFAGQVGKVVGKTTSLVRDAYGPEVEDQISEHDHEEPTAVLERIKEAAESIKSGALEKLQEEGPSGETRIDELREGLDILSDNIKLAATQAGLTAVTAAGAALKANNEQPSTSSRSTEKLESVASETKSEGSTTGKQHEPKKVDKASVSVGSPVGADKKGTQVVESFVGSHLKQEVTGVQPAAVLSTEIDSAKPAAVVVDALKEKLADFAGGVEEEIKKKQAEREAEKKHKSETQRQQGGIRKRSKGELRPPGATRVRVGRERHIPVNKVDLISAMRELFENPAEVAGFVAVCTSVESILHAEHQVIMEELRADYAITHADEDEEDIEASREAENRAAEIDAEAEGSNGVSTEVTGSRTNNSQGTISGVLEESSEDSEEPNGVAESSAKLVKSVVSSKKKKAKEAISKVKDTVAGEGSDGNERFGSNGAGRVGKIVLTEPGRGTLVQSKFGAVVDAGKARRDAKEESLERFETNVLEILSRGQFEALTSRDLELTAALNQDYLLTLPINVDWQSSSKEAIIFRRGYSVERESGRMTGPKTDYLQSFFLQSLFKGATRPLYKVGTRLRKGYESFSENKNIRPILRKIERWLGEPLPVEGDAEKAGAAAIEARGGPVTVPRYEAFLSSAGSRGLLIKKLLISLGLVPEERDKLADLAEEIAAREKDLSPRYVSRVSMADVFKPSEEQTKGLKPFERVKATAQVMFADTTLLEPAYREMVILYTPQPSDDKPTLWQRWLRRPKSALQRRFKRVPKEGGAKEREKEGGEAGSQGKLQLNMYKDIPIPELKVVFPDKKLSYRLLDTVRLDLTTILGVLAFGLQYRFDDLNSIQNFVLDFIAFASLSYFLFRTSLSYARTFDRYRLLVNKTLYEKTLASGFGVIHFLVDASEDQQFKEAALAYGLLLKADTWQTQEDLAAACISFVEQSCGAQILMPVDRALDTLLRLGLAESSKDPPASTPTHSRESGDSESDGSSSLPPESGSLIEVESQASPQASDADVSHLGSLTEGGSSETAIEAEGVSNDTSSKEMSSREAIEGLQSKAEINESENNGSKQNLEAEGSENGVSERQILYRAVRTKDALPGLEKRWLGLLMRPSAWALSEETH